MKPPGLICLMAFLGTLSSVLAQDKKADPPGVPVVSYQIKVGDQGVVEIDQTLLVGVFGDFSTQIAQKLTSDAATVKPNLTLYLDGFPMTGLVPVILPAEAFPGFGPKPGLVLQYTLSRNPNDEANRKAWDALLPHLGNGIQMLQVGVGLENGIPHLSPGNDLPFQVASSFLVVGVTLGCLLMFFLLMWWAGSTSMLREAGPGTAYSLGKTQMAFWGLLVAMSFVGVLLVGHRMERISPQVLVLLGISGTTGLSSVLIASSKRSAANGQVTLLQGDLDDLKQQQAAVASRTVAVATLPIVDPGQASLQNVVQTEKAAIDTKVQAKQKAIETQKKEAAQVPSETWWKDIISDAYGLSFHRFQVVLWTLILGVVFGYTVATTFSMPEFEPTLLILMGISNGTYLGFKIPESQGGGSA